MGWKKIITSLSNAVLNSLTTTGNVSASGNLYADLPSNEVNNGLVVVQDQIQVNYLKLEVMVVEVEVVMLILM